MGKPIQLLTDRERLLLDKAQSKSFLKLEGGDSLSIHFYFPKDLSKDPLRPAMLFFNGGAWDRGSVTQFAPHALHFVERGVVCGLVEYRNRSSHPESNPADSMTDTEAAMRFLEQHGETLCVDPSRMVLVGAGAGANIAAGVAMRGDQASPSIKPAAVVVYSPIIDVDKDGFGWEQFESSQQAKEVGLSRQVRSGLPPMLIIHGTADRLLPFEGVMEFSRRMVRKKNICRLVEFEGRDQNFFNLNVDPISYEGVLLVTSEFLDEQGILPFDRENDVTQVISWREKDF